MTLKQIIEGKIENTKNDYYEIYREALCATIGSQEDIKLTNKCYELLGKIEAYEDILAIIKSDKYE